MSVKRSLSETSSSSITSNGTSCKKEKRAAEIALNSNYMNQRSGLFEELKDTWRNKAELTNNDLVKCLSSPFPCWVLSDFVGDEESGRGYLESLRESLMKLKFHGKDNDLYQFKQSDDLKNCKSNPVKRFRELLIEEMLPWLRELTGIDLTEGVDSTCSKYEYTDTLLCHDDELEGRRIAFIYYLVDKTWCTTDGGTLDLFNTDEYGRPKDIVSSIVPKWNSFVFFEVTPTSFHQVSEVFTATKTRLSINGWFHGPPLSRPTPYKELPLPYAPPVDLPLEVLEQWINPVYLDIGIQAQIRDQFEKESQIELPDFLLTEKYKMLCESLKSTSWSMEGPPNRNDCLRLLLSDPFCLLLSHLTGLQLSSHSLRLDPVPSENETETSTDGGGAEPCGCHGNWYCWERGDYTLMSDNDNEDEFVLEGRLYFDCNECNIDTGGYTAYIVKDEDEELLTILPQSNSLSLTYRDSDTLCFTKYINHRLEDTVCYYSTLAVYKEHTISNE